MFSLSRLSMLIVAFFLGFAVSAGAIFGVGFYAVNSLTINQIEDLSGGKVNFQTDKVMGPNPEVDLRDMSIIALFDEMADLKALNETVTINLLVSRYDLIIHEKIDKLLSDEARDMPITYLMTDEGKDAFFSTLYIGQIQGFECLGADGELASPKDADAYWHDPVADKTITGLNEILANFSLGDVLAGRVSSDSLLNDIILAEVLGYTYDDANSCWIDGNGAKVTGVMAVFADCTVLQVDEKLNSVEIGELLGYEKNGEGKWCEDDGTGNMVPVHGFMNVVASKTLHTVGGIMNDLTIGDIIPPEQQTGFVGMLDPDTKFDNISTEVNEKFNETSMRELVLNDVILFEDEQDRENFLNSSFADKNISELLTAVSQLSSALP